MGGVHHFLTDNHFGPSALRRLDPRAKLVGLVGMVLVVVSTPARSVWAFALYAAILVFLVGLARLPLLYVVKRLLVVLPFVLVVAIFIPFFNSAGQGGFSLGSLEVSNAGLLVFWNTTVKSLLSVLAMVILLSTTSFPQLSAAMESLKIPKLFTLITSFMYRYSFIIAEEFARMRRAMDARGYRGRWVADWRILSQAFSSLFMRSYGRSERVYVCMLSRGYDASARSALALNFAARDGVFLSLLAAALLGIRLAA